VVRIYHDEIFSLVSDEAATPVQGQVTVGGETFQSLGEYRVNSIKGDAEEIRHKVQMTVPGGYTEVEVSPDVVGTPTEFTHMAEFLLDRHAPGEHVTGLFCRSGDEKVAQRLAAVMGVEYLTTEPTAQAPAPEPAVDTTVAAPVPAPEG
jgi:hypothetical protein